MGRRKGIRDMTTYRIDRDGEIIEPVTVLDNGKGRLLRVRNEDGQVFDVSPCRVRQEDLAR
jgi:hypothetical protein